MMSIDSRITRIEQSNRRLRTQLRLLCVLIVLLPLAAFRALPHDPADLSVRSLQIVNDQGIVVASLGATEEGGHMLVATSEGKPTAAIRSHAGYGVASLSNTRNGACVVLEADSSPRLVLGTALGADALRLCCDAFGHGRLEILRGDGTVALAAGAIQPEGEDSSGFLSLEDGHRKRAVSIGSLKTGGFVKVSGGNALGGVTLCIDPEDNGTVIVTNSEGTTDPSQR